MRARAFCPGHVTGFFQIHRAEDLLSTGSRGAGFCLDLGATSDVVARASPRQRIQVTIDGKASRAEVTKTALRRLLADEKMEFSVRTTLDLPQSQGFGMSAAGALSACMAAADILGRTRQEAFEAAHIAEIVCGCGLGDVSAIHKGGITIRERPGLPPIGSVRRIGGRPEVVLAVVGRRLLTRSVLTDPAKTRAINANGGRKVDELLSRPSLRRLVELSYSFALETGLASKRIKSVIESASDHGLASMSMLGNSVFAVGDTRALRRKLSEYGPTYVCRVNTSGPKVL